MLCIILAVVGVAMRMMSSQLISLLSSFQIIADIFNTNVYISTETANSASLGAAYIAKRVAMNGSISFQEAVRGGPCYQLANSPRPEAKDIYEPLLARYSKLEKTISTTILMENNM